MSLQSHVSATAGPSAALDECTVRALPRPRARWVRRLRPSASGGEVGMPWRARLPAVVLTGVVFLGSRAVHAQGTPSGDTLLARLTAEALAGNPSLAESRATASAARARVRAAGALPDPMLGAGVMNLTLPRFALRESDFTEVDVELTQQFPWPGTLGARTEVSRAEVRAREADAGARRSDVVVRTAGLYYGLRYVVTARATLVRQRRLLAAAVDVALARYATTTAPQGDPLQARVALARLDTEEADLAAQEIEFRSRLKALRNVKGRDSLAIEPIRPQLVLSTAQPPSPAPTDEPADSGAVHPRIAARRAELDVAERRVRIERLGTRPDFTVMTRYGARPLGPDFFSAFVGISLPIFAGRKQLRLADAARAEAHAARAALEQEQASLAEEISTARARLRSGATRLGLLTGKVLPAARASAESSLRSYRVGSVQFLTVLSAEDARYRAELDAARVAADYLTYLVMLEQLLAREDAA